ncbi:hypothetical protein Tco_1565304, partial [Tanacetum coccineum]
EDLEVLWNIVKDRFKKTEPENYMDNYLLPTWKKQQGLTKVNTWKLFDSCGMFNDVKLQVDYECEMAYKLLRLVKRQLKEGYKMNIKFRGGLLGLKDFKMILRVATAQLVLLVLKVSTAE